MFESLVWAIPIAVAAVGLYRPSAAWCALAAAFPFFGAGPGGPYLLALDVAVIAALVTSSVGASRVRSGLDYPVMAYAAVSVASVIPFPYRPPSWQPRLLLEMLLSAAEAPSYTPLFTVRALLSLVLGVSVYVCVKQTFAGESLRPLGLAFTSSSVILATLGLLELAGWIDLHGYRPIGEWVFWTRLHSLYFHSGWLAELLVIASPLAIATLLSGRRVSRFLVAPYVLLLLVTLLLTQARSAWFATLAQVLALVFLRADLLNSRRLRRNIALGGVTFVLVVVAVVLLRPSLAEPVAQRLKSATADLAGRPLLWRAAIELTAERPLLGWGLGSFAPVFELRWPKLWNANGSPPGTAHSLYFNVAAERGLLGLATLAVLGIAVAVALSRRVRDSDDNSRAMYTGLAVSFVGIAVYGLTQHMPYLRVIDLAMWLLLGAIASRTSEPSTAVRNTSRGIVAIALLAIPIRVLTLEAPVTEGDRAFGFHMPESDAVHTWRWSDGQSARRIPRAGNTLIIELANGHIRNAEHPVRVTISIDGRQVLDRQISGYWEEHRFTLEGAADTTLIEVSASPTFRPFSAFRPYLEAPQPGDARRLAIAVGEPRFEVNAP